MIYLFALYINCITSDFLIDMKPFELMQGEKKKHSNRKKENDMGTLIVLMYNETNVNLNYLNDLCHC